MGCSRSCCHQRHSQCMLLEESDHFHQLLPEAYVARQGETLQTGSTSSCKEHLHRKAAEETPQPPQEVTLILNWPGWQMMAHLPPIHPTSSWQMMVVYKPKQESRCHYWTEADGGSMAKRSRNIAEAENHEPWGACVGQKIII